MARSTVEEDGFHIAARVYMVLEGRIPSMANRPDSDSSSSTVFDNLRPDVVVTIADRYETIATAIAASYMNIPVVHLQGGEVTGSIDEKVRRSDETLELALCQCGGKRRLPVWARIPEPCLPDTRRSIAVDACRTQALEFDPFEYGGVGERIDYSHGLSRGDAASRDDRVRDGAPPCPRDAGGRDRCRTSGTVVLAQRRCRIGRTSSIGTFEKRSVADDHFFKYMEPQDFLQLLYHSRCIVGNSSVGIRECAFLGVPVVNIGTRQEGRDRSRNVLDVGYDRGAIRAAIERQLANGRYPSDPLYGTGDAGIRCAELLSKIPLRTEKRLTY
jgi:hypothetical protein